ncbi:MAG: DUF309 domain-containing protein [Myxococcota bacterium]
MASDDSAEVLPRYCGARPFPAYAYFPGEGPHPTRSPQGHSYGRDPEPSSSAFEWGVDLYNHGYPWEAHEAWENLWRAASPGSADAVFFRGLIQCAAACLKVRVGRHEAARRLGARALEHIGCAIQDGVDARGLDLAVFTTRFAAWLGAEPIDRVAHPRMQLRDRVGTKRQGRPGSDAP